MTNQEILEKAISKAIDGGWNPYGQSECSDKWKKNMADIATSIRGYFNLSDLTNEIIFSHDFAKALWGDGVVYPYDYAAVKGNELSGNYGWDYHLQQMVIADNPIQYLGDHI